MGLDFLANHGARRVRQDDPQPLLLNDGAMLEQNADESTDLDYEVPSGDWQPHSVASATPPAGWPWRPLRFVDGKDVGSTAAWLQTREGYPIPVRLSQIGAVVMRDVDGVLRREAGIVERVVTLMVDPFPWDEVESFAVALQQREFRLLTCPAPAKDEQTGIGGWSYDFERMRKTTQNRSNDEMGRLERRALAAEPGVPTLVDGRLEPRAGAFNGATDAVVGLIKTHSKNYLHPQGWRAFYNLAPAQRTPAFRLQGRNLEVVTWYLRIDGGRGELPNSGIVRIELPEQVFNQALGRDWGSLDRLSRLIYDYRCRDPGYSRASISITPIQQAEESLGAMFIAGEALMQKFYRMTSL